MSVRRVRIYKGSEEAMVVGFSASATDAPDNPRFDDFMSKRGYKWHDIAADEGQGKGIAHRQIEIRPPLTAEHLIDFGQLCVGGVIEGEYQGGIVDPYHDGVEVIDNRETAPEHIRLGGILVARC